MQQGLEADANCARCPTYVCRLGYRDLGPPDCPMRGEFPTPESLYRDREDLLAVARLAAIIEGEGYRRWTRAEEVVELAHRLGVRRIGLAACRDMGLEVDIYAKWLGGAELQVVRGPVEGAPEGCDPVGQALRLNQAGTGLNVVMGMCVGHDALFIRASKAPTTALVARDAFLQHNPVAALHLNRSYFERPLRSGHRRAPRSQEQGLLHQAAQDPLGPAAAKVAAVAEEVAREGAGRWSRVEELIEFAHRAGAQTLGLIFCLGLKEEARVLHQVLTVNNFRVRSVQCKSGAVPKEEMGILDAQKVRPGKPEMMCNPLAQAEVLNRQGTDLNVLVGQCVGHDTGAMTHSGPLTVCLVAKDRVLGHNSAAALYRAALREKVQGLGRE